MRPIPVVFHIGPLQVHTYGIGLALTFWFGYRYFCRRLRQHGHPDAWMGATFVWIVVAAIVGARVAHVIANFGAYTSDPLEVFAVWHGGLSSFGGLALAVPIGLWEMHRRCPQLRLSVAADLVAPVLVAAWAVGRLLGPQLMVAGGGKPTTAWYGMYYAGEAGRRIPVPILQALECFAIYLVALAVSRYVVGRGGPIGLVVSCATGLWGLSRFFDEFFWLGPDNGTDAVEVAGLCFFAAGVGVAGYLLWRDRVRHGAGRREGDPFATPKLRADEPAELAHAVEAGSGR